MFFTFPNWFPICNISVAIQHLSFDSLELRSRLLTLGIVNALITLLSLYRSLVANLSLGVERQSPRHCNFLQNCSTKLRIFPHIFKEYS